MKFHWDETEDTISLNGEVFEMGDEESFEVPASRVKKIVLSAIPVGCSIVLCDRVIGSDELYSRSPSITFEHTDDSRFVAHVSTPFFLRDGDEVESSAQQDFLRESIRKGCEALSVFEAEARLLKSDKSIQDEIAYLNYSLLLPDQLILEAEAFIDAIEDRIEAGVKRPLMFICHASEDKPFVEKLVAELDRRALHAWFDKREIFVGDSIVQRINEALEETSYLVCVLSSRSVMNPWCSGNSIRL